MLKRLLQTAPAARMLFAASVCLGLAGGVLIIMEAFWVARITDRAFLGKEGLSQLLPAMAVLLGWIVMRVLVHIAGDLVSTKLASRVKHDLRNRLVRKMAELGPQAAKKERSGEWIAALYEGVEQLETYLARYVPQMALSALIPAAILCAVVRLDWTTALILTVTLPMLIFFMILIGINAKAATERQFKTLGLLSGHFHDVVRGLPTLQIFNRSKAQLAIIGRIGEEHRKTTMGTLRLAFLSAFVMELFATLSTAVVAVFLGLRLLAGDIDFYRAYTVLLLAPEFYQPVRAFGAQFHTGMNGRTSAERIMDILDAEPPGWTEREGAQALPDDSRGFDLTFEKVSFRYPDAETDALSDVSLHMKAGQRIALIGHTGAGKSTLLDLLQGFIKPTAGSIRINGTDLAGLSIGWWRSKLAVVPQRTHLFQGTVLDNLLFGRPEASMEEVVEAAKRARADEFIRRLPKGYDTPIGEAVRLSGGQMQRIAIARALLKDAPVLLLDEPTAQLDLQNEAAVLSAWNEPGRRRTVIMAAHRLDTVRDADYVVVLQNGRIAEAGKPDALLGQGGMYAAMVHALTVDESPQDDGSSTTEEVNA